MMPRLIEDISSINFRKQWDVIAESRYDQISTGKDITYSNVLIPTVMSLANKNKIKGEILDAGCGLGFLSSELIEFCDHVIGVDFSEKNISLAKNEFSKRNNVHFVCESIEEFSTKNPSRFSQIVANMLLMDVPNLEGVLKSINFALDDAGDFIFTITHPCYWPRYWGYEEQSWFDYNSEIAISSDFMISLEKNSVGETVHFHRPLEMYFNALWESGFTIDRVVEPIPDERVSRKYPTPWRYPRYLALKCTKR